MEGHRELWTQPSDFQSPLWLPPYNPCLSSLYWATWVGLNKSSLSRRHLPPLLTFPLYLNAPQPGLRGCLLSVPSHIFPCMSFLFPLLYLPGELLGILQSLLRPQTVLVHQPDRVCSLPLP